MSTADEAATRTVVVPAALDAVRLDRALASLLPGVSRAELARWIEAGRVALAGRVELRPSTKVHAGAAVEVRPMPPPPTDARPDPSVVFTVLHQDEHLVVVDKPAGLVVHPSKGHPTGTLVNGLLSLGALAPPEEGAEGAPLPRPGIVHRIDKGTSGVLVVARTVLARERLKAAFSAHRVERVYDALVVGSLPAHVTFDTPYGRHPTNRKAFTGKPRGVGKRAITHVTVVERFSGACRVECRLLTGRTHQIRVHLSEGGTPLLGDPLYGRPPRSAKLRAIGEALGRQALHARVLGFEHPITGERMHFEAPWPEDFCAALEGLRRA